MSEPNLFIIANLIAARARTHSDLEILSFESNGEVETRTYKQLWDNGQRIAGALYQRGVKKGDRFALLMLNHPEFVEAMIASAIVGSVFVPIDPRSRESKLAYMLKNAGCQGVICGAYALEGLLDALKQVPTVNWVYAFGAVPAPQVDRSQITLLALEQVLASPVPHPSLPVRISDPRDPMQVMYTSGTTGDPKGIVVPHQRFGAVSNHGEAVFGYRAGDRPYTGLSLTHGNAQFVTLAPSLKMGLPAVISRKFSKSRLWDIVRQHRCTTFALLGGMVTAIYSEQRRPDDADNPVRLVISAGMPAAIWTDFGQRFGVEIFEFYGAVEGGMTFKRPGEGPVGSCGRAAPGLVAKVVDEFGVEVRRGTPGELLFQLADGPFPAVEYLGNPEASARKTADGWLRSGDIVRMDGEGWIFFEYRAGGGIRRNGEFVSPALIEKVLAEHPDIDDVFVYGIANISGAPGEKDIVAAVVPKNGVTFEPRSLSSWLKPRLEPSMIPDFVQQVSEIPKTASEKPQERFLVELLRKHPETVTDNRGAPNASATGQERAS
jgi:carnitine-CoA ligase